jgi:hypothetical protein
VPNTELARLKFATTKQDKLPKFTRKPLRLKTLRNLPARVGEACTHLCPPTKTAGDTKAARQLGYMTCQWPLGSSWAPRMFEWT